MIGDLKGILARGGDPAELRRYVAQMEQNPSVAEQTGRKVDQTTREAEQILQSAREQGVGVEEYLRWNWEQYDADGEWNAAARKALELEKGNRQYSFADREKNNLDNSTSREENGLNQYEAGGVRNDNGKVRGRTAEGSGIFGVDGRTGTENTGSAQTGREWRNQTTSVQRLVKKAVKNHINTTSNAVEVFELLCLYAGETDARETKTAPGNRCCFHIKLSNTK